MPDVATDADAAAAAAAAAAASTAIDGSGLVLMRVSVRKHTAAAVSVHQVPMFFSEKGG